MYLGKIRTQAPADITMTYMTVKERCRDKDVICIWTTLGMD